MLKLIRKKRKDPRVQDLFSGCYDVVLQNFEPPQPPLQVTVPSVALSHATPTTTAATTATPRLPPAPAPPKTAVRQNGLGVTWPNQRNAGQPDLLHRSSLIFCCFSII